MDTALLFDHAVAHEEAVEEDTGHPKCYLGQIQQHARLVDEIDTFGTAQALLSGRDPIENTWRAQDLVRIKEPLAPGRCKRRLRP